MNQINVTLTTAAKAVTALKIYSPWVMIYNSSASDAVYWGGENVTTATGYKLAAGTASYPIVRADNRCPVFLIFMIGTSGSDTATIFYE